MEVTEAMRKEGLKTLDVLVGEWTLTMSDAWFLEPAFPYERNEKFIRRGGGVAVARRRERRRAG